MSKIYKDDVGTIILVDCGINITTATVRELKVKKPDGTYATWAGVQEGTNQIKYVLQAGDVNQDGTYVIQAKVTMPSWSGSGEETILRVAKGI